MLNTPSEQIKLPKNIEEEVKKVKNQIAINEQELITIKKARASEEYTVRKLLEEKEEIKKEKSKLENSLNSITEKLSTLSKNVNSLIVQKNSLIKQNDDLGSKIAKQKLELGNKDEKLKNKEEMLRIKEVKLNKIKEENREEHRRIINFMENIKKVISKF